MAKVAGKGSIIPQEKPERTCRKWQLRVSLGRDYVTGDYITKTKRVQGTKTQAQKELREFINELESGIRTDTQNLTFGEFADNWFQEQVMAGDIELGTQRKLDYQIRTLCKHIGNVRLLDLNAETITSLYILLKNGGSLKGGSLSGTTTHNMAIALKNILSDAVRRDIILRNPCDKVKTPKLDTKEKKALSKEDARRLIGLLIDGEPDAHRIGVLLAIMCGLRREEVMGLCWGDLDESSKSIKINRCLPSDVRQIKEPKSKASKRTIPLDERTFEHLKRWKVKQGVLLLGLGLSQGSTRPIVTSEIGSFMHPENFGRWWRNWGKKNGFEGYSLHQLRHTFATLLVANNVDIITAKKLMGHSGTQMLTDIYAHSVPENVSKATEMMGGVLYGKEDTAPVIEVEIERTA